MLSDLDSAPPRRRSQASVAFGELMVCSVIHACAWILLANHGDHLLVPSARVIRTMNLPVPRKILERSISSLPSCLVCWIAQPRELHGNTRPGRCRLALAGALLFAA